METQAKLAESLNHVPNISHEDRDAMLALVEIFHSYPIIRADYAMDDWIAEAWWRKLQDERV